MKDGRKGGRKGKGGRIGEKDGRRGRGKHDEHKGKPNQGSQIFIKKHLSFLRLHLSFYINEGEGSYADASRHEGYFCCG